LNIVERFFVTPLVYLVSSSVIIRLQTPTFLLPQPIYFPGNECRRRNCTESASSCHDLAPMSSSVSSRMPRRGRGVRRPPRITS
jgi:hypothetical protein